MNDCPACRDAQTRPTHSRVRELLHYDQATGVITHSARAKKPGLSGRVAGTVNAGGYRQIRVDGKHYYAHRLAWLLSYGEWPNDKVDHINGDPGDNRLVNLRDVSQRVNSENRQRPNKNCRGLLGVIREGNRYLAKIKVGYVQRRIGTFATPEAAHEAYLCAKRALHQGCTL